MCMQRNPIERCNGVLKRRFGILQKPIELHDYSLQTQLLYALFAVHNFIRLEDPQADAQFVAEERADALRAAADSAEHFCFAEADDREVAAARDSIADALWAQYRLDCLARGLPVGEVAVEVD